MTIRFLKQWNGHAPDSISSTLGGAEEARLIGLGFATADLDGDTDGDRGFVEYRKSVTGRIEFSKGIVVGEATPDDNDGREDGTIYIKY